MYEDYEPEYYEPTEEELEECMGYSDTTTKLEENNLKIEFDFSNFHRELSGALLKVLRQTLRRKYLVKYQNLYLKT